MDEGGLIRMPINDLLGLMVAKTHELLLLKPDQELYETTKSELELIQKVVLARKSEIPPGPYI
jgi:hypothetical protein